MTLKRIYLIAGVGIISAAAVVALWYWQSHLAQQAAKPTVGAQIFNQVNNPIEAQVPETNPFKAKTNPFGVELNPFQKVYTNPFK